MRFTSRRVITIQIAGGLGSLRNYDTDAEITVIQFVSRN